MKTHAKKNIPPVTVSLKVQGDGMLATVREGREVLCIVDGSVAFVDRTLRRLGLPVLQTIGHSIDEVLEVAAPLDQTRRGARHVALVGKEPADRHG